MIFVTVGTHNKGFDRLVKAADEYAETTNEHVMIQLGSSSYIPTRSEYSRYFEYAEMLEITKKSRVIVSHSGAGSILMILQHEKPLVLVPRRKIYEEVGDDHQLELTRAMSSAGHAVECKQLTADGLADAIESAISHTKKPAGPQELLKNLQVFLNSLD